PSARDSDRLMRCGGARLRRVDLVGGAEPGGGRGAGGHAVEHRRARRGALHPLLLFLPGVRHDPAHRDDRRDRHHSASQGRGQASGRRRPGRPRSRDRGRASQGHLARRHLKDRLMDLSAYLTLAAIVFTIGIAGIILNHKNIIIILMSVELILLSVNINLVAFSSYSGDLTGQAYALFVLTVAAAEAAIGLAILVAYFRNRGSIAVEDINSLKG